MSVSRPVRLLVLGALLAGGGLAAWWGSRPTSSGGEVRDVEKAYIALRDSILQGNDEAFFEMHSRNARETAIRELPVIRSWYLGAPEAEREAFHRLYHVTADEFLKGDPRALVLRMLPWRSGWRDRVDMYRTARVRDVRIRPVDRPDGVRERVGILVLDISEGLAPGEAARVPENYLPTVVFVLEEEGWRRRAFFSE